MKVAAHITFYFNEFRLKYLQKVVENLQKIDEDVTIYIYSNKDFTLFNNEPNIRLLLFPYKRGGLIKFSNRSIYDQLGFKKWMHPSFITWEHKEQLEEKIYTQIINKLGIKKWIHPFFLTWEHRKVMKQYIDEYDVQMYLEDDIKFTNKNFDYWLEHSQTLAKYGYNLGFLRVEQNEDKLYLTDLTKSLDKTIKINGRKYLVNDNNPYCGFWIKSKEELKEFSESKEWDFEFTGYGIREKAAIGWHGKGMKRYKNTLLPLTERLGAYETNEDCAVYHLPNNYINHETFCRIQFPLTLSKSDDEMEYNRNHIDAYLPI